jgi:hypothetical protein
VFVQVAVLTSNNSALQGQLSAAQRAAQAASGGAETNLAQVSADIAQKVRVWGH